MTRISLLTLLMFIGLTGAFSQKLNGKLTFATGQVLEIITESQTRVTQEAAGNAIDFDVNGKAFHHYRITNATDDNATLHHEVKRITFKFEGMGQNRSFDSDNKKDLEGFFGAPVKDVLTKNYDMIIDPAGKTLLVKPEKIELAKTDDRLAIVFNMLKDLTGVVYPPRKNESSFFKILPDTAVGINDTWVETTDDATGKSKTTYTVASITDTVVVITLKGTSASVTKSEMMGMQTTTSMKNEYSGTITLDRTTGIVREKKVVTESSGSTEAMGGNLPVSSKSTITIKVRPVQL